MNILDLMEEIEGLVGDTKIEIHKAVPLTYGQKIAVAIACETLLDRIEAVIQNADIPGTE